MIPILLALLVLVAVAGLSFTLIPLEVDVDISEALAGVLSPVFAQARETSAKTSLSPGDRSEVNMVLAKVKSTLASPTFPSGPLKSSSIGANTTLTLRRIQAAALARTIPARWRTAVAQFGLIPFVLLEFTPTSPNQKMLWAVEQTKASDGSLHGKRFFLGFQLPANITEVPGSSTRGQA